jgi:hypothetical protein
MLRTEHIVRNIKKENFLALVGCQVSFQTKHHLVLHLSHEFFPLSCISTLRSVHNQVLVVALVAAASFVVKCFLRSVVQWNLKLRTITELFSVIASFPWLAILYTGMLSTTFCLWAEVSISLDVWFLFSEQHFFDSF